VQEQGGRVYSGGNGGGAQGNGMGWRSWWVDSLFAGVEKKELYVLDGKDLMQTV
jgi:hypothetical protein